MAINLNGTTGITTTGLTSNGIDDNATSTAMTLDTSGNLLVGKASNSFGTTGVALNPDGSNNMTRSGDPALALNRLTSDGAILGLYKDGTNVGSIKSRNSESLMIGSDYGSDAYICLSNDNVFPVTSTGAVKDAATNLGVSTGRWKDLYLSGGVYLGGTGSANKLDDYEEGTWTPILDNVTVTYSTQNGTYTKIGNLVSARFEIGVASLDTTDPSGLRVGGLPFIVSDSGCLFTMDTENSSVITNKPNILGARPIVSASAVMLTQNGSVFTYNSGTASSGSLIGMVQYYA